MNSVEDVMLDLAWRRFSEVWQDKRDIETKASILLTASGLLLGLIVNALKTFDFGPVFLTHIRLVFLIASASLFSSIFFSVLTIKPRVYNTFDLKETLCDLREETALSNDKRLKWRLYRALIVKERDNSKNIDDASKYLVKATWSFLVGCASITIAIILTIPLI